MEGFGDLFCVYEREIALSPLDTTDVCPVQTAEIGEFFLRDSEFMPPLANGSAEPDSNVFHIEIAYLASPLLMCPRTMSIIPPLAAPNLCAFK